MEPYKILIASTKEQKRYTFETCATTLGELMTEMDARGINYIGQDFTEGLTKTKLADRNAVLPTPSRTINYGGQEYSCVMLLTNTTKNISSGAFDQTRKDAYGIIKMRGLQDAVKERFGRNFTQVGTDDLWTFIYERNVSNRELPNDADYDVDDVDVEEEKEDAYEAPKATHPDFVEWVYLGIKSSTKAKILDAADVAVLADLLGELAKRLELETELTDEDIDEMLKSI